MKALEKKAIEAAWEAVLSAQVAVGNFPDPKQRIEIEESLTEARSWLEVFFVVEKNES